METRRGMGRYVTGREETIMKIKREMAQDILERFVRGMQELGFQSEEIVKAVADNIAAKESRGM
ncbi:hypothetical protein D3C84_1263850 [compost metagenome]